MKKDKNKEIYTILNRAAQHNPYNKSISEKEEEQLVEEIWRLNETYTPLEINEILKDFNGLDLSLDQITDGTIKKRSISHLQSRTKEWSNYLEDYQTTIATPYWFSPKNLAELETDINTCLQNNIPLKPFGDQHSSSEVAKPQGHAACLDMSQFRFNDNGTYGLHHYMDGTDDLVHLEAGMAVLQANIILESLGLALPNMGSYDGQSLIGAICTGTHGSNRDIGPMAEFVMGVDMYYIDNSSTGAAELKRVRIMKEGIGNPNRDYPIEVIQDNNLLHQAVVSMGCFGWVFALILKLEKSFLLEETRTATDWQNLRNNFEDLFDYEFADVILNPNKRRNKNTALITIRKRTTKTEIIPKPQIPQLGEPLQKFAAHHPALGNLIFNSNLKNKRPTEKNKPNRDRSHKIFFLGGGTYLATSIEIAVPIEQAKEAIDYIIAITDQFNYWHTSPIGIRFVAKSQHHLSFAHNRRICTIEIPLLKWQYQNIEKLRYWHNALIQRFKGRPHWGQLNWITLVEAENMYEHFEAWRNQYEIYNQAGLLSNDFTQRLGLDQVLSVLQ